MPNCYPIETRLSQHSTLTLLQVTPWQPLNTDTHLSPCFRQLHVFIEKAFDSLDHNFLISAFEKYGFGKNFISWVKISLKNQGSCVLNGGTTTKYFLLGRGARQGDPISAYLF